MTDYSNCGCQCCDHGFVEPIVGDSIKMRQHEKIKSLESRLSIAVEALKTAKKTIKSFHGEAAWDIYEKHAPEMKQINEALKRIEGEK